MTLKSPSVGQFTQIGGDSVYALYLPGVNGTNSQAHVNCGAFWQVASTTLGNLMHWRMWLRRELPDDSGYIISDGYGGAHALLLNGVGQGNIYTVGTGTAPGGTISFGADESCPAQQWYELSIGIKTDAVGTPKIIVYMNGIPVGMTNLGVPPNVNVRATPPFGAGGGCGTLYIGGSTHQNFCGQLAMIQAWDNTNPFSNGGMFANPVERFYSNGHGTPLPEDLWLDFTDPAGQVIRDLSWGYASGVAPTITNRIRHNGRVGNSAGEQNQFGLPVQSPTVYPVPYHVLTDSHPWTRQTPPIAPGGRNFVVPPPPAGAKIFDSFSREDVTMAFDNVGNLRTTESGTLGPKTWNQLVCLNATPAFPIFGQWGLFNGRLVNVDTIPSIAYVVSDSANFTAHVDNRAGTYGNGNTSIAFRIVDGLNYYFAYIFWNEVQVPQLALVKVVAGVTTGLANTPLARGEYTLEVIANGTSITVNALPQGGGAPLATLGPIVDASLSSTRIGCIQFVSGNHDWGLARWDNFTVF